jgi:TPR repeat protein
MLRLTQLFIFVLLPAIAQADLVSAHRAFESGNYKSAFTQLQPLAAQGNIEAQSNLAWLYRNGAGTQRDDAKALHWYLLAAEQGDAYAQYNYAQMCEQGLGIEQSYEKAAHWYEQAARQGQRPVFAWRNVY